VDPFSTMLRPMPMTALPRTLTCALFLVVVQGCGSGGTRDVLAKTDPAPSVAEVQVTCANGRDYWPVSAMAGGIPKSESGDLVRALEKLAEDAGIDAPLAFQGTSVEDAEWFVLARDGHAAAVATGPWSPAGPGKHGGIVYLEHVGAGWEAMSWGGCGTLQPFVDDGEQWVEIDQVSGSRDTTEPTLLVTDNQCASGRDPRPFLQEPSIAETEDSVTVSWTVTAAPGFNDCIGVGPFPAQLHLTRPLGDRTLYDGSTWPARKVG